MRNFSIFTKSFTMSSNPIVSLLLMVIALCATRISSSPLQQQQQQHMQLQQQQQHHQQQKQQVTTIRVQQCREGCLEKFTTKDVLCQQNAECLTCWEECSKSPPNKISKSIRETWSLHTVSMIQQDSLVLVDVAWEQLSVPYQCLVTWEVAGGGLMGNLLTESFNVQLSLWPDTRYRVQVTCKNKLSGLMSRSLPLTIDTSEAVKAIDASLQPQIKSTLRKQSIAAYITNKPIFISPSQKTVLTTTTATTTTTTTAIANSKKITNSASSPPSTTPTTTMLRKRITSTATTIVQQPTDNLMMNVNDDTDDANVVPYDDQQSEELDENQQHTNFIFNWHMSKSQSGLESIEALHKTEKNILQIFDNIHKPLLFGMTAGITLLMLLMLLFACPLQRSRTLMNDKIVLMAEDGMSNGNGLTLPPALAAARASAAAHSQTRESDDDEQQQQHHHLESCKSPAVCSRNTLRV